MKITFITLKKLTIYGGAEKWIIDTCNWLKEKGYEVTTVSSNLLLDKERISMGELRRKIKFKYIVLEKLKFLKDVTFYIYKENPDIVYLVDYGLSPLIPLIYNKVKKIIIGNHPLTFIPTFKFQRLKIVSLKLLSKYLAKKKNLLIHALSKKQEIFYKNLGFANIIYLQNFVDSKRYKFPENTEDFIVLFIGRLHYQKGIDILCKTIDIVLSKNEEIKFKIIGNGFQIYKNKILELCREYGENVRYLGFVPERIKIDALSRSSLLFLPSRGEGFPLTIIESLVSGTPFLSSNLHVFREILWRFDKNFGYIVKRNSPECFAEKIIEIYEIWKKDKEKYYNNRIYIHKKARKFFDIDSVLNKFIRKFLK